MNVQELFAEVTTAPVVKRAITNHEALNEAYDYGSAFSRGMRIDFNGLTILLISGTASIDESAARSTSATCAPSFAAPSRTSPNCSPPRARPGMTSSARPATCATSSATTRPSTKSARRSTKSRSSTRCRRPPVSRRFCAVRIC